jgi:hypothetical protein
MRFGLPIGATLPLAALAALAALATIACGRGDGDAGGAVVSEGAPEACLGSLAASSRAAACPSGGAATPPCTSEPYSGPPAIFAVSRLYLGDTDPKTGDFSSSAWKSLGYDIDGTISKASPPGLCKPAGGGTASVHNDGTGGIDNSFGANLLPIITGLVSNPSELLDRDLVDGRWSILFRVEGLGDASCYPSLAASMLAAGDLGGAPKLDGSDRWPVRCESLAGCGEGRPSLEAPLDALPVSFVVDRTWVSGPRTTLTLTLELGRVPIRLDLAAALVTLDLARGDASPRGIISGVVPTAQMVEAMRAIVVALEPASCGSETLASIASTVEGASDILADGTQDPGRTCDGISIGIGFDAAPAQISGVLPRARGAVTCGAGASGVEN